MPALQPTIQTALTDPESITVSVSPPKVAGLKPRSRSWLWVVILVIGLAVIGFVIYWAIDWLTGGPGGKPPLTATAMSGELKITVSDRGELESINPVQVICELQGGGKLVSILPEGTPVEKGTEVAKLDTDVLTKAINEQEIKWEAAESKVNAARSELSQTKNKAKSEISKAELALVYAEIDLEAYTDPDGEFTRDRDKAKGALELARKNLKEAEDDLEFTKGLVKKGFAQLDMVRTKEYALQQQKLNASSAEAELTVLEKFTKKKKLTELKAKANEAKIELERTKEIQATAIAKVEDDVKSSLKTAEIEKKQLERIRKQMDQCIIKAPSPGIVVYYNARYWDESARIRPGAQLYYQQPIFTLPDLSKMRVKMKVHESVVKKVKVGNTATMQIDALPNRVLNGKVLKIATLPQSEGWRGGAVKQYETEVSIDDLPADAGLKPGMTAEVKILINTIPDAISVPVQAVAEFEGESVVYIAGRRITRHVVTVGDSNEQYIQILSGLEPDEKVALDARLRAAAELKASGNTKPVEKPSEKPAPPQQ
ncbi:MAG: efflux RND transporter periplasmic adaptor subunit [Fimbriiglobus sp.]